jgi:DNA helicase II / ATP-dependent DNA helicase PcrA
VTLLPMQVALTEAGIAHSRPLGVALLERTGIRTALAYLRIAADPADIRRSDITDTVRRPSRKIARNVVELLTKRARTSVDDIQGLADYLSGHDAPRVEQYAQDLQTIADTARRGDTAKVLEVVRNRIGLGEAMAVLDSSRKEADRSTHGDDLDALISVARLHPEIETFEPWLRTVLSRDAEGPVDSNGATGAVELSTVHRVKGREWNRVIVYGASAGLMPHRLASDKPEERRVFHVAITRGREQVVVVGDREALSPFVDETHEPGEPERFVKLIRPAVPEKSAGATKKSAAVPASIGLEVAIPGGFEGVVIDLTDNVAILEAGKARTEVSFGSQVRVRGKLVELAAPLDEEVAALLTALKEWRSTTATEQKVPAYTVFHDAHLEGIARSKPTSLVQLSQCSGVGPAKLDRWGDELLAVIETATG